jgi:hypothetical protein
MIFNLFNTDLKHDLKQSFVHFISCSCFHMLLKYNFISCLAHFTFLYFISCFEFELNFCQNLFLFSYILEICIFVVFMPTTRKLDYWPTKVFCNLQDTKPILNCQEQHHHKQLYLTTHNKVLKKISIIILGDVKHPLMNFASVSVWFNTFFKGENIILHVMLFIINFDLTTSHEKDHIIIDSLVSFGYTQHCQFYFR